MKKLSMLAAIVILFATTLLAQSPTVDVLYVKNGSIIRGQIIELSLELVRIETADGSLFVYPMTEIDRIEIEPIAAPTIVVEPVTEEKPVPEPVIVVEPVTEEKPVPEQIIVVEPTTEEKPVPEPEFISFALGGGLFGSLQIWDQLEDKSSSKTGFGFMSTIAAGIRMDDMYLGIGPHLGASFLPHSYVVGGTTGRAVTNVFDIGGNLVFGFVDDMYVIIGLGSAEVSITATVGGQSETVDMPESASYKRVSFGWENGYSAGISYVSYSDWAKNLNRFEINLGYAF